MSDEDNAAFAKLRGMIAYSVQDTPDCAAAVDYWKKGFAKFGTEQPPKYELNEDTKEAKRPYDTDQVMSFISLYNPQPDPNAQCVFVTCPGKGNGGPALKGPSVLVCGILPKAVYEGESPFL